MWKKPSETEIKGRGWVEVSKVEISRKPKVVYLVFQKRLLVIVKNVVY